METARETGVPAQPSSDSGYVAVTFVDTGETYRCQKRVGLLESMRRLGVSGIPVGCRSGGCSVCKIEVLSGSYQQFRPMSREYVTEEDLAAGRVLACCIHPLEDLTVRAIGKLGRIIARQCSNEAR
ncbi:MAG: 2Fe-2S iron-sulfur cluster binding domain-containing protein [Hyphomicrobiales bacterium]